MALKTRLEPFDLSRDVLVAAELTASGQAKLFQQAAREELAKGQDRNRSALGYVPPHHTTVDQARGAAIENAKPDSTIIFEFQLIETALVFIGQLLEKHSPVRSGRFRSSFMLFADGVEADPAKPPPAADEYAWINSQPYARKLERGLSPQAPEGVADVVATLAKRRWGNIANIRFSFRAFPAGAVGRWAQRPSARHLAQRVRGRNQASHTDWCRRLCWARTVSPAIGNASCDRRGSPRPRRNVRGQYPAAYEGVPRTLSDVRFPDLRATGEVICRTRARPRCASRLVEPREIPCGGPRLQGVFQYPRCDPSARS